MNYRMFVQLVFVTAGIVRCLGGQKGSFALLTNSYNREDHYYFRCIKDRFRKQTGSL